MVRDTKAAAEADMNATSEQRQGTCFPVGELMFQMPGHTRAHLAEVLALRRAREVAVEVVRWEGRIMGAQIHQAPTRKTTRDREARGTGG